MSTYDGKNKEKSSIKLAVDRSKFRIDRMSEQEKVMKYAQNLSKICGMYFTQ